MKYYTPQEIADLLHQSIWTIRDKILRGDFGDTLNIGKTHLVTESGLKQYIETRTGPAGQKKMQSSTFRVRHYPKAEKL